MEVVLICFGAYSLMIGLKSFMAIMIFALDYRFAPGYEVFGKYPLLYVSGPRNMDPSLYGYADPSNLIYHEKGLLVFRRKWFFRSWLFGVSIPTAMCGFFSALGLWILLPYLKIFFE